MISDSYAESAGGREEPAGEAREGAGVSRKMCDSLAEDEEQERGAVCRGIEMFEP